MNALLMSLMVLSAQAESDIEAPRVLILDARSTEALTDEARTLSQLVAQAITDRCEVEVLSQADLGALLELEAEKQASGCDDQSCLSEIAGALNAEIVVASELARVGSVNVFQVNLYDQKTASFASRKTLSAPSIDALVQQIDRMGGELVAPLVASGRLQARAQKASGSPLFLTGVTSAGIGGVLAVGGAIGLLSAASIVGDTGAETGTRRNMKSAAPWLLGAVIVGVGAAAVGGGLALAAE